MRRPHAETFFKELQHYYEIVVFSDDVFPVAFDIIQKWEAPVAGVLHRDFCKRRRNHYVKDISKLGRLPEKVLIVDHDPAAFSLQPEAGIQIRPFDGDPDDQELLYLIDFLKACALHASSSGKDVREFLALNGGGDVDVGRRFLVQKKRDDEIVAQRRQLGSRFSGSSKRTSGDGKVPRFGGPAMR